MFQKLLKAYSCESFNILHSTSVIAHSWVVTSLMTTPHSLWQARLMSFSQVSVKYENTLEYHTSFETLRESKEASMSLIIGKSRKEASDSKQLCHFLIHPPTHSALLHDEHDDRLVSCERWRTENFSHVKAAVGFSKTQQRLCVCSTNDMDDGRLCEI